ncbi:MAG: IS200/IS605 family transposase [Phycisphaerales bacterium]|nr:IS200/IS605 family transposase [Phycisphaerales bacterium]
MGSTLCCHYLHIIFSTKGREPWISSDIAPRLYAYLGGIARARQCTIARAGGVEDHIHLLAAMHPACALADLIRDLKANSSRWMHDEARVPTFAWQTGYAAFSVSRSNIDAVSTYIDSQPDHHARRSYQDELIDFLRRHGVDFDERHLLN